MGAAPKRALNSQNWPRLAAVAGTRALANDIQGSRPLFLLCAALILISRRRPLQVSLASLPFPSSLPSRAGLESARVTGILGGPFCLVYIRLALLTLKLPLSFLRKQWAADLQCLMCLQLAKIIRTITKWRFVSLLLLLLLLPLLDLLPLISRNKARTLS